MEKFTQQQLVIAMEKYNLQVASNPSEFKPLDEALKTPRETAERQIEHLLSLVES